jgi:hypothetical protein
MRQDATPFTKAELKMLRQLVSLAHERELGTAFVAIEETIAAWRRGEVSAFEASDALHEFHQGPARRLWAKYQGGDREFLVVAAAADGVLTEADMSPALWARIHAKLQDWRGSS